MAQKDAYSQLGQAALWFAAAAGVVVACFVWSWASQSIHVPLWLNFDIPFRTKYGAVEHITPQWICTSACTLSAFLVTYLVTTYGLWGAIDRFCTWRNQSR